MSSTLLFVYGTLMFGKRNHWRLKGQKYLGEARTAQPYYLYDRERYPVMIEGTSYGYGVLSCIHGEIYMVDEKCIRMNDGFEGVPVFYKRKEIQIQFTNERSFGLAYCYVGTSRIFDIHEDLPKHAIATRWLSPEEKRKAATGLKLRRPPGLIQDSMRGHFS